MRANESPAEDCFQLANDTCLDTAHIRDCRRVRNHRSELFGKLGHRADRRAEDANMALRGHLGRVQGDGGKELTGAFRRLW